MTARSAPTTAKPPGGYQDRLEELLFNPRSAGSPLPPLSFRQIRHRSGAELLEGSWPSDFERAATFDSGRTIPKVIAAVGQDWRRREAPRVRHRGFLPGAIFTRRIRWMQRCTSP
jgi:hypothetical protein